MDTSEQYIKMCEKAEEIQDLNGRSDTETAWDLGDYYYGTSRWEAANITTWDVTKPCVRLYDPYERDFRILPAIWVPHQDQLQEMLAEYKSPHVLLEELYNHLLQENLGSLEETTYWSMEQLWLAFVMKEKWNKIWSNGEWKEG